LDLTSFSHGQIHSKIWLCDNLEPYLTKNCNILILGGWYNVLGFMLFVRNNDINKITTIDIDKKVKPIADKISDAWIYYDKVENITLDVDTLTSTDYEKYDVIINCSLEHMNTNSIWFDNIPNNKLICLQSSDVLIKEDPWLITNPIINLEYFTQKYKIQNQYFIDEKQIKIDNYGYKRFMLIGLK